MAEYGLKDNYCSKCQDPNARGVWIAKDNAPIYWILCDSCYTLAVSKSKEIAEHYARRRK